VTARPKGANAILFAAAAGVAFMLGHFVLAAALGVFAYGEYWAARPR
jgi:hypothetical protein